MVFRINFSVSSFIGSLMEHRQWLDVSFKKFLLEAMMDLRFIFLGISLISKNLSWNMTSTSFSNIFFTWPSQLFSRIISYGDSCFRLHLHCMKGVHIRSYISGPYFPAFGLNTERYLRISPYSVRVRKNTDQKKLRIWTLFTQCDYTESKNRAIISYYHCMILLTKRRI